MTRVGGDLTAEEVDSTLRVLHHMQVALEELDGRD